MSKGQFRRYEHLERLDHMETAGIEIGRVYVFPKLDGTNASVWLDSAGQVQCGSRNRVLSAEHDNHGFHAWVHGDTPKASLLRTVVASNPGCVHYGEWLVPHTINAYRDEAWRCFWIFDVFAHDDSGGGYLPYEEYATVLQGLDVVQPLCIINNPSTDQLIAQCETNTYLVRDGAGVGEGIVLKRYDWRNGNGKQVWAKVVRNEFKERNRAAFGITEKHGEFMVEQDIATKFCTATLIGKTRAKVVAAVANDHGIDLTQPNAQQQVESTHRRNVIPQLLGRVWNDFIVEEMWSVLKEHSNPTIDFKRLHYHVVSRVKQCAGDLFGSALVNEPKEAP